MIEFDVKCNLDCAKGERWPYRLYTLPRVGDLIQSAIVYGGGYRMELEVYNIRWIPHKDNVTFRMEFLWTPEIELHIPKYLWMTIAEFTKYHESRK